MSEELVANFELNNENFDALFEIYASGTVWGSISGTLSNQTDLQAALDLKADKTELNTAVLELNTAIQNEAATRAENDTLLQNNIDAETLARQNADTTLQGNIDTLSGTVTSNYNALDARITTNTGNISDINTTLSGYGNIVTHNVSEFATSAQGALADTALQPNDNISELTNDANYITAASLPTNYVTTDTIQDITGLKTIKNQLKIQSGDGDGALFIGADATATTLSNNVRKLARINMPTNEDITLPITIISGDTRGDTGSTIGQTGNISNRIEFGGRTGATGNTSPDGVAFCVAKVHNSKLSTDKVYALEMSATQARFNVPPNYNGANIATETYVDTGLASKQTTSNLVTSISSSSTDTQYPSAKCMYDIVGDIETALNTINSGV